MHLVHALKALENVLVNIEALEVSHVLIIAGEFNKNLHTSTVCRM